MSKNYTFKELIEMYEKKRSDSIKACRLFNPLRITAVATFKPHYTVIGKTDTTKADTTQPKSTAPKPPFTNNDITGLDVKIMLCNMKYARLPRIASICQEPIKYTISTPTANTDRYIKADKTAKDSTTDIIQNASKAFTILKANASDKKIVSDRYIREVKRCTTISEKAQYNHMFKKAFVKAVLNEYRTKKKNRTNTTKALKAQFAQTNNKILLLDKKIKACNSIISQLASDKTNTELIVRKSDIIGIDSNVTLSEITATKKQLSDTMHSALKSLDLISNSINELSDLKNSYRTILHSNEISIEITTNNLVNNVSFGLKVGYPCNNDNSTFAIRHIYELTEIALKNLKIKDYFINVNYNIFENNNAVLPLARQITKRQSVNMIQRQGSKTQYQIYYACMRNDFTDHDTADLYSVCYTTILTALSATNAAAVRANIRILEKLNHAIQHLNSVIDIEKIENLTAAANKAIKKYHGVISAAADYNKNKRLVTMLENIHAAAANRDITDLKTACYNAMNNYLTSIRAIRDPDKITLDIDQYTDRLITTIDIDNAAAAKSHILILAYNETKKQLTKSTLQTFSYMTKGYTAAQIAEKRKLRLSTISEHITEIKAAFIKAYTDLTNSGAIDNTDNVIVFDPALLAAVKSISEKTEKIITTYTKNTEIEKITAAVNADLSAAACMKYEFKKYIKELKKRDLQVVSLLLDNKSIRETAAAADIGKSSVLRIKTKILDTFYSIIELSTDISIDRNALVKVDFSKLVSILID